MSKKKSEESGVVYEDVTDAEGPTPPEPPQPLPIGLKEKADDAAAADEAKVAEMEAALKDGWERVVSWRNRRTFFTPGGVVPQGVLRPTEEAYALEVQRRG